MKILESILDFPQPELCRTVWDKREDGTYTLTHNVKKHIMFILKWIYDKYKLSGLNIRINGSICSNCYSDDSDIDIHLSKDGMPLDEADYYFNKIREDFRDEFTVKYPQVAEIDGYRFEVCFQTNSVKDLMSVGCYDVLRDEWLVGPCIKDLNFDPYEEYYLDDIQFITNSLIIVRRNVMELREKSLVFVSTKSKKLRQTLSHELVDLMKTSELLFNHLREIRKTISDRVNSPESANEIINSREWQVADSSHKLITKFGYFEILRNARHFLSGYEAGEMTMLEVANNILKTTSEHLNYINSNNQLLSESIGDIDESLANTAKNMFLAFIFSIAGIVSFESLARNLSDIDITNEAQIEQQIEELLKNNTDPKFPSRNGESLNAYHAANCAAITLYKEGGNQYRKNGQISIDAIASTIFNRAKQDGTNVIKVISKNGNYSEWRDGVYKGGWNDNTYTNQLPIGMKNINTQKVWRLDCKIAVQLLRGEFESVIGDRDMMANIKIDSASSFFSWGIKSDICIGDHWFGKDNRTPDNDPDISGLPNDSHIIIMKRTQHKVEKGEYISKIAKDNDVTINWIKVFNPSIVDLAKIQPGQTITIVKMEQMTTKKDVTKTYLKDNEKYIDNACLRLDKYRAEQIRQQQNIKNKKTNKHISTSIKNAQPIQKTKPTQKTSFPKNDDKSKTIKTNQNNKQQINYKTKAPTNKRKTNNINVKSKKK